MDFSKLQYIKNINDGEGRWAYKDYLTNSYFQLNFKEGKGVSTHARNLPQGSFIILSQRHPQRQERYLTHVVELMNSGEEDQPQWNTGTWGIFRWVKVHWITSNFERCDAIPSDQATMKVDWGWRNTQAKSLEASSLMSEWKTIEALRGHLQNVFV